METNPLPSYIFIDGFELYVTYKGQTVTSRFCGETGHVQMNCEKRMLEFPKLSHTFYSQETDNTIKKSKFVQMHAQKRDAVANSSLPFVSETPINLSKKRKLFAEPRVDLTGEEIQSVRLFDKVCCSAPTCGRVVSATVSETGFSSSTPASAIIFDAYTSIIKKKKINKR